MAKFEEVGVRAVVKGYDRFIFQIGSMGRSVKGFGAASASAAIGVGAVTLAIGALVAGAAVAVGAIAAITGGIIKLGVDGIQTARSFEDAFAGVLKTTYGLGNGLYDLTDIGERVFQDFRNLAKEIPLSFEELSAIGEIAGQLGIAEDQLAGFTKIVAQLSIAAPSLSQEDAAFALARIANVYNVSSEDMIDNSERMGSTIAWLGNEIEANENEILIFSRNIAGTTSVMGIAQKELFALAAGFTATGNTAEAGGSSVQRVLVEMSKAVQTGGEDLEKWAKASGMTAEEFATQWSQEGGAAKNFMGFMEQLHEGGQTAISTLDTLDVDTIRVIRTMLSAAGGYEKLVKAMDGANAAWEIQDQNFLSREAEIRFNTISSKLEIAKNKFRDLSFVIGDELVPVFEPLMTTILDPFIQGLEQGLPGAVETVAGILERRFIPALEGLAEAFGLTDPTSVEEMIRSFGDTIGEYIIDISDFVTNLTEFVDLYKSGDLVAAFEALGFQTAVAEDFASLAESFEELGESLSKLNENVNEEGIFGRLLSNATIKQLEYVVDLVTRISDGVGSIWRVVEQVGGGLTGQGWEGTGDALKEAGETAGTAIVGRNTLKLLGNLFSKDFWSQAMEGEGLNEALSEKFSELAPTEESTEVLGAKVRETLVPAFSQTFEELPAEVQPSVDAGMDQIGTDVKTNLTETTDEVDSMARLAFRAIGENMMKAAAVGVRAYANQLIAAITSSIQAAIQAANNAAGIQSPSTEGIRIGSMISQGMVLGLLENSDAMQSAMVSSVSGTINAGAASVPGITNNTSSVDNSFNIGDISMETKENSPFSVADNLSLIALMRG